MDIAKITARVYDTDERITVNPMVVLGYGGDFSVLRFADENGYAMWLADDGQWLVDSERGEYGYSERVEGVFGSDEEGWETVVNEKLAGYGFRLGDFDEEYGDRYFLVAL